MTECPRKSGALIAQHAKNISIKEQGISVLATTIAKALENGSLALDRFSQGGFHPKTADDDAIEWIFVVDTLNFCFWTPGSSKWEVSWNGAKQTGYFALCAAINRALDEGIPITSSDFYSKMTIQDLNKILRSDEGADTCPLMDKRLECLHQVGIALLEKYDGKFSNCVKSCDKSATKLLETIVQDFECFRDEAKFNGIKVSLYKRAQILIGDIWACFKGTGSGEFTDIGEITMFADYRVPQVLVHFGAMVYSDELMELLKKEELLENGSEEEVEIRGCSIEVVERVRKEIENILPNVRAVPDKSEGSILCNSIIIDHFLWDYRRAHAEELSHIPFHRTLSIYY